MPFFKTTLKNTDRSHSLLQKGHRNAEVTQKFIAILWYKAMVTQEEVRSRKHEKKKNVYTAEEFNVWSQSKKEVKNVARSQF